MEEYRLTFKQIEALEEKLEEELGTKEFLDSLLKAMDIDKKEELFKYIARCWDIPYTEEEPEEE